MLPQLQSRLKPAGNNRAKAQLLSRAKNKLNKAVQLEGFIAGLGTFLAAGLPGRRLSKW